MSTPRATPIATTIRIPVACIARSTRSPWRHTAGHYNFSWNTAAVDSRLRPSPHPVRNEYFSDICRRAKFVFLAFVLYRRIGIYMTRHRAIMWKHDVICKTGSTQRRRTEPHGHRQRARKYENLLKFGRLVFELCEQTDRHTHHNSSHGPFPGAIIIRRSAARYM